MIFKSGKGLLALSKQTLAVLTSSVASLLNSQAGYGNIIQNYDYNKLDQTKEEFIKFILKPKLVLKQNSKNPSGYLLALHSSHSSHSSHASSSSGSGHYSHSSHSSHASHYSSAPSYIPLNTAPYNSPELNSSEPRKHSTSYPTPPANLTLNQKLDPDSTNLLLTRVLYKGCEGNDVEDLQYILSKLGYDVLVTQYFGDKTEDAVIKFQRENELKPDGKVGTKTYLAMKNKLK